MAPTSVGKLQGSINRSDGRSALLTEPPSQADTAMAALQYRVTFEFGVYVLTRQRPSHSLPCMPMVEKTMVGHRHLGLYENNAVDLTARARKLRSGGTGWREINSKPDAIINSESLGQRGARIG